MAYTLFYRALSTLLFFVSVDCHSVDVMDKSALQQRLEARRNMFFNKPEPGQATASSALSFAASRIGRTMFRPLLVVYRHYHGPIQHNFLHGRTYMDGCRGVDS